MNDGFIIFIILFTLFIIVTFIIIWPIIINIEPELPPPVELENISYGMRCDSKNKCAEGLSCVAYSQTTSLCKISLGNKCNSLNECTPSAATCSTICTTSEFGDIDQHGPCNEGLVLNENNICKYDVDSKGCFENNDCIQGICQKNVNGENVCLVKRENNCICSENFECESNNCTGGFCQESGIKNGGINSLCSSDIKCNENLSCYIDYSLDENAMYGTCEVNVNSWPLGACNNNTSCVAPSICWNGNCVMPRTNEEFLTNNCNVYTHKCIENYKCDGTLCIPEDGKNLPGLKQNKIGIVKWNRKNLIGTWEYIDIVPYLPEELGTFSVLNSNNFIYKSLNGWVHLSKNTVEIIRVDKKLEIINLQYTQNLGLFITYKYNKIYTSHLFRVIPDFSVPLKLNFPTGNYKKITSIKYSNINDILLDGNIKVSFIDNENNLFIAINHPNSNYNFVHISTNIIWCELYSSNLTYSYNEYIYKTILNDKILVMTDDGLFNEDFPPLEDFKTRPLTIMSQSVFPATAEKISDISMLYIVNYSSGNLEFRAYNKGNDSIYPGYFYPQTQINISKTNREDYFLLTTLN